METVIKKWGNSNGIRIPNSILKSLNLKTNDKVELQDQDDKIIISKKKNKISLAEKFENYNETNLAKDYTWDSPKGKEIW